MSDIYVMNGDGSGQRNITRDAAYYEGVAWSPDGKRIAFAAQKRVKPNRDLWATNVYVMNANGGAIRQLTRTNWADHPVWSPDSRRIAFLRHGGRVGSAVAEVFLIDSNGRRLRRLTRDRVDEYSLAWSKRNRIAFVRSRLSGLETEKGEIITINPNGTGERRLTNNGTAESGLAWSPNGRKLLFVRLLSSDLPSLFVVNADGTKERRLRPAGVANDGYNWPDIATPAWSPDGSRIGFLGGVSGFSTEFVYVMRASGAGLHKVSRRDPGLPSWSPDGRKIAFHQHPAIFVVNADGTGRHRILPRPGRPASSLHENWTPVWAPS